MTWMILYGSVMNAEVTAIRVTEAHKLEAGGLVTALRA